MEKQGVDLSDSVQGQVVGYSELSNDPPGFVKYM